MPTLYVHIGTTKTGTTAIQNFCKQNNDAFVKKGYCYPILPYRYTNIAVARNAHFLAGGYRNSDGSRDTQKDKIILNEGMDEIIKLLSEYENVVLSDEGIWHATYKYRKNLWKFLKEKSLEHNFNVKIIVYLRRQDSFATSWFNQQIKSAFNPPYSLMEWETFINQKPLGIVADYYTQLENIANSLGRENIIVRVFDRKAFKGEQGNIYSDFLDAIGLNLTDEFTISDPVPNQSITGNAQEIKRVINILTDCDSKKLELFNASVFACADSNNDSTNYSMFSQEEQENFLAQFDEGNSKIAKEYLHKEDGILFEKTTNHPPKWTKKNEDMNEDIIYFFGDVIIKQQQKIDNLQNQLNNVYKELKYFNYIIRCLKHPFKFIKIKIKRATKK